MINAEPELIKLIGLWRNTYVSLPICAFYTGINLSNIIGTQIIYGYIYKFIFAKLNENCLPKTFSSMIC